MMAVARGGAVPAETGLVLDGGDAMSSSKNAQLLHADSQAIRRRPADGTAAVDPGCEPELRIHCSTDHAHAGPQPWMLIKGRVGNILGEPLSHL
jgi:hypothetical protein